MVKKCRKVHLLSHSLGGIMTAQFLNEYLPQIF